MSFKFSITICGAGIAGVACAYYLSKMHSGLKIILIDKYQPLAFTTSKSGENYRDYWPQKHMSHFVSRSIELMKELKTEHGADVFELRPSGYHFVSHEQEHNILGLSSEEAKQHDIEILLDSETIHSQYAYLDPGIKKILHIKNAGSMDVNGLGSLMFKCSRAQGVHFVQDEILDIKQDKKGFALKLNSGETLNSDLLLIASGPFLNHLASMIGIHFPIYNTIQNKIFMPDPKKIIPRSMPFTIYTDEQLLDWSVEEKVLLESDSELNYLLQKLPGGLHIKPEGNGIKMGWAFNTKNETPNWEIPNSELFPQIVLKGACRIIPSLKAYERNIPIPLIHYSGYYTRTKENWPLIGQTEIPNAYVLGALAGYGTMSACAGGELCAKTILGLDPLPSYARYFSPMRSRDEEVIQLINAINYDGQL